MSAVGGNGRSTTSGLLAAGMAALGSTAVLDTAPRLSSPWPSWVTEPGAGLLAVPPHLPLTRRQLMAAASQCAGPADRSWQVLTDHQDWSSPPLPLPQDPAAWYQLAAIGGWQAVVVDTAHPVAHDVVAARCAGQAGLTAAWSMQPFSVPVLCAATTSAGIQALQTTVMAASAEGLPLQRMVVALVAVSEGRLPAQVKAAETMLRPRVSAIVHVPHDLHIRSHGLRYAARLKARSLEASGELARAVLASAAATWGDPLPAAAVPATLPPVHTVPEEVSE